MGPRLSQPSVQVAAVSAELRPPGVRMDPRHSQPNTQSHIYKTSGAYEAGWPEPPPCARARRAGPPQRGHHSVACTRGDPARSGAPTRPLARGLRGTSARASQFSYGCAAGPGLPRRTPRLRQRSAHANTHLRGPWPGLGPRPDACAQAGKVRNCYTALLLTPPRLVPTPGTLTERQHGAVEQVKMQNVVRHYR